MVHRALLNTDIEGSTAIWERTGRYFRLALEQHHAVVRREIERFHGEEVREAGDGFLIAFDNIEDAARCAVSMQQAFSRTEWPARVGSVTVRMGLHLGELEVDGRGEYQGLVLHRAARVAAAAHGGQIVCSQAAAEELRGEFELLDLGVFRLRGISGPEHLFQVCWPDMPQREFARPAARVAYTSNLPTTFTRFFGRERELAELHQMLRPSISGRTGQSSRSIVTVTGPGGTGKTRLAIAVAEGLVEEFGDAVWFVPLAELHDPDLLLPHICDALEITRDPARSPIELLEEFLAPQASLLVLDNFEQLGRASTACLESILRRLPNLRILITSRQRLGFPGEREFAVSPLRIPRKGVIVDQLMEFESVQLFVDRTRAVRSSFALSERNASAVADLCRRLEGVPLALELAAARIDVVSPREMVEALTRRLDFFTTSSEHVPPRHRSLRAAIDWSYGFLPPALQRFFANLSVFRGGWTAETARIVAMPPELNSSAESVLQALSELRSASLIRSFEAGESMRFTMLETLRQYAEEHLQSTGESRAVAAAHRGCFLEIAEAAEREMRRGDQSHWLDRLELETENLRVAVEEQGNFEETARLAAALAHFWMVRGYVAEGRGVLARHLARVSELDPATRAALENAAGMLAWQAGDAAAARASFEQALKHFRAVGDRRNVATMLNNLGIVAARSGALDEARQRFEESVHHYTELQMDGQRAQALANLGGVFSDLGDRPTAQQHLRAALETFRRVQDGFGMYSALHNLADLSFAEGGYADCERLALESAEVCQRLQHKEGLLNNWRLLSHVAGAEGKHAASVRWWAAADFIVREFEVTEAGETIAAASGQFAESRQALTDADYKQSWFEGESLAMRTLYRSSEETL